MDLKILPVLKAADCEKNYEHEPWHKFARRITRNPFVKSFLAQRDAGKCAWCGETITGAGDIHHTTYNHSCTFAGTIIVRQQTVQRHARKREVPDCEKCMADNQARFEACMGKLVLVHQRCNIEISAQQAAQDLKPQT